MGLSVLVISGSAALYAFAMRRASQDAGKAQVVSQAQTVADDIARTVRKSIGCDTFSYLGNKSLGSPKILRCVMPEKSVDTDGIAGNDGYVASAVSEGGAEAYLSGSCIYYLWLDKGYGGNPANRLVKISDASADPATISMDPETWDKVFTFTSFEDKTFRFDRVTNLDFQVDSQGRSVLITVKGSGVGLGSSASQVSGDELSLKESQVQRRAGWINELDGREQGTGPNLLVNGDFAKANFDGWTVSGNLTNNTLTTNYGLAAGSFYSVQMNSGNTASNFILDQTVETDPAEEHVLSFSYGFYGSPSSTLFGWLQVTVLDPETKTILLQREINDRSAKTSITDFWTDYSFVFKPIGKTTQVVFVDRTNSLSTVNCDPFLAKVAIRRLK